MKKVVWLVCAAVVLGSGVITSRVHATPQKRWAIVNFTDPVAVKGHLLQGAYLVVHDDARMAKGEPCTTIYQFDRAKGPQAAEVAFMCKPAQRAACDKTTVSVDYDSALGVRKLTEYQFAGDDEGHGVPGR